MKFLDPTSTVREGEFATVEQTAGVPEQVAVMFNKTLRGEKLTEKQRQEIVDAAQSTYPGYLAQYEKDIEPYMRRADAFGVPREQLALVDPWPLPKKPDLPPGTEGIAQDPQDGPSVQVPEGYKLEMIDGRWEAVPL
jgi:hypothetical protein